MAKKEKKATKALKDLGITDEEIKIIEKMDDEDLAFTEDDDFQMGHHIILHIATDKDFALSINSAIDDMIINNSITSKVAVEVMRSLESALRSALKNKC